MKPLNLEKALELFNILCDHIQDTKEPDAYTFVGKIVDSVIQKNRHEDYLKAASLMFDLPIDELVKFKPKEVIDMFIEGLIANKILELLDFAKEFSNG